MTVRLPPAFARRLRAYPDRRDACRLSSRRRRSARRARRRRPSRSSASPWANPAAPGGVEGDSRRASSCRFAPPGRARRTWGGVVRGRRRTRGRAARYARVSARCRPRFGRRGAVDASPPRARASIPPTRTASLTPQARACLAAGPRCETATACTVRPAPPFRRRCRRRGGKRTSSSPAIAGDARRGDGATARPPLGAAPLSRRRRTPCACRCVLTSRASFAMWPGEPGRSRLLRSWTVGIDSLAGGELVDKVEGALLNLGPPRAAIGPSAAREFLRPRACAKEDWVEQISRDPAHPKRIEHRRLRGCRRPPRGSPSADNGPVRRNRASLRVDRRPIKKSANRCASVCVCDPTRYCIPRRHLHAGRLRDRWDHGWRAHPSPAVRGATSMPSPMRRGHGGRCRSCAPCATTTTGRTRRPRRVDAGILRLRPRLEPSAFARPPPPRRYLDAPADRNVVRLFPARAPPPTGLDAPRWGSRGGLLTRRPGRDGATSEPDLGAETRLRRVRWRHLVHVRVQRREPPIDTACSNDPSSPRTSRTTSSTGRGPGGLHS